MRWQPVPYSSGNDAAFEAGANEFFRQFAANEDDAAFALLAVLPFPLMIAFQHHMHTLEDIAVIIAGEGKYALRAQDLLALGLDQVLQPGHEQHGIERLVAAQRQRLHLLVMIVLQAMAVV